jgi:hypothetical protein
MPDFLMAARRFPPPWSIEALMQFDLYQTTSSGIRFYYARQGEF